MGVELELDEEPELLEDEPVDGAGELLFSAGLAEEDSDEDESAFLAPLSAESDDLPPDSARESLR